MLRQLPAYGLPAEDQQDVQAVAEEALDELTRPDADPEPGKLRRARAALLGFLTPVAAGAGAGAGEGARELARHAIEQLGSAF